MTWTRLMYIKSVKTAFKRVIPGEPHDELHVCKRYQAQIKKQFRLNGVPWIYDLKSPSEHHRNRRPKEAKRVAEKEERLKRIQKNLSENEQKMRQFRQQRLNNRELGGIDRIIAKTLPSFIKGDSEQIPDYLKKSSREGKEKKNS